MAGAPETAPPRTRRAKRRHPAPSGTPIPEALRTFDPLVRSRPRGPSSWLGTAALIVAAGVAHVAVVSALYAANAIIPKDLRGAAEDEIVEMAIVEPPPPIEPEPEPETKPEPETPTPKAEKPKPVKEVPEPEAPKEPPKAPETKTEPPAPRRIVGLSFESTVSGGGGPSFAVGNTQRGSTDKTAVDPVLANRTPLGEAKAPETAGNRKSTRVGTGGKVLTKPARKRLLKPEYPEAYRAQNLEADVVVEVSLDQSGKVVAVRLVSPSPHGEFNRAAEQAAWREEFTPATRDGSPVPFTLTFTYRFRLSE